MKLLQSFISVILVFNILTGGSCVFASNASTKKNNGNLIVITNKDDFSAGTQNNTVFDETIGDGAIKLANGVKDGDFVSQIYNVSEFECMVASWNSDTPEGTYVEIQAKVYVDKKWTNWLSWGQWSPYIMRSCSTESDELAYVDTDVLTVRGNENQTASKVQLKAVLHSDIDNVSPVIRQIAATYKCDIKGKEIKSTFRGKPIELPEKVILDTPAYSQMVRDNDISNSICSPTTIATMLNDRGEDLLPEEVALSEYDFKYQGFGNWAFSLAFAGACGYESYIQYCDMDIIYQELAKGYSVGISVQYSDKPNGSLPYVEGAPLTTNGHLITVRGYEKIDGVDYIYTSDSAAADDKSSLLKFKVEDIKKAWCGITYIVHDKEKNAGQFGSHHYKGELVPAEGKKNEYELRVDGKKVELQKGFMSKKLTVLGCGTLAYTFNDAVPVAMTAPSITTTANNKFYYDASVSKDSNITLNPDYILPDAAVGESKELTVYAVSNVGKVYIASTTITKASSDEAVEASKKDTAVSNKFQIPLWIYITGAVVIVAIVGGVLLLLRIKKKN